MSEHKFNVGDRVIDKNFSGQVLIVKRVYQDVIDDVVDVYREGDDSTIVKYFSKNLEPVSDHIMKADEIAELFKETEEKDKKEHTLPNPADLMSKMDEDTQQIIDKVEEKVQERTKGYQIGAEDAMKDIQRIKQEEYDRGYKDGQKNGRRPVTTKETESAYRAGHKKGYDEGFILGMKTVIRNVERFLKEIQP